MTALPNVPTFVAGAPTVAELNALSYAVSFLSNQSVRPTWKVWKASSQALSSNTWAQILPNANVPFDSDSNAFTVNGFANIETQGIYATECCVQIQNSVSTVNTWSVAFQITGGPNNPNLNQGSTMWYGYRASGTSETTGGASVADDAFTCSSLTPICLYPGDQVCPVVICSAAKTLDILKNTNFIQARFAFVFTGYWVGLESNVTTPSSSPGPPPPPPPPTPDTLQLGINQDDFTAMQSAVGGANAARIYVGAGGSSPNGLAPPTAWPTVTGDAGITNCTVSIIPNLNNLLNGTKVADNGSGQTTVFGQIQFLAQQAPPGAKLTIWHEAGNLYQSNAMITPQNIRSSHVMVKQACAGTNVEYGCVIYGNINNMAEWIPNAPFAMDWYGIDIYDNDNSNNGSSFQNANGTVNQGKVDTYLSQYQALAISRSGVKQPVIDVTETNSPTQANRPNWFTYVATWLYNNNKKTTRMLTFYKCGGASSGCWVTNDSATFTAFNTIVTDFG